MLHHRHTGEVIISVLLLQDLIAIIALLVVHGLRGGQPPMLGIALLFMALPALGAVAWFGQRWLLLKLFRKFDRIQEYIFLLAIGWCLGLAQLAQTLGLSYRDRRLHRRRGDRHQPHRPAHRRKPEAAAGFFPDPVFLRPRRRL